MGSRFRTLTIGAIATGLAVALAACGPTPQQADNRQSDPFAQQPWNNGWPSGPQQPGQPGQPGVPGQPGWPQAPGMAQPGQPGWPQAPASPQPGYPGASAALSAPTPRGMDPLQAQAGAVFVSTMNGSRSAGQLSQALLQGVQGYFDGPPQVMGAMTDPSDMFGQIGFQATLRGRPVMGIIAVMSDGRSGGRGYLMFDAAERFNQTAPLMMNAVQQNAGAGGGYPGADRRTSW